MNNFTKFENNQIVNFLELYNVVLEKKLIVTQSLKA